VKSPAWMAGLALRNMDVASSKPFA